MKRLLLSQFALPKSNGLIPHSSGSGALRAIGRTSMVRLASFRRIHMHTHKKLLQKFTCALGVCVKVVHSELGRCRAPQRPMPSVIARRGQIIVTARRPRRRTVPSTTKSLQIRARTEYSTLCIHLVAPPYSIFSTFVPTILARELSRAVM